MQIRLLGVHQGESRDTKFISILVDGVLALDAGSITSGLTFVEQARLSSILLTHYHYDHIKDIPMIGLNTIDTSQIKVYCLPECREALEEHILNHSIWPKLNDIPRPDAPNIIFYDVAASREVCVEGYDVLPVAMRHTAPAVGYNVSHDGHSFFFTGDTSGGCHEAWQQIRPDVLFIEATLPDRLAENALRFGHLTPAAIGVELRDFYALHNFYPRVIAVHIDPKHEQEIRRELARVSQELGTPIEVGYEGMLVDL